MSFNPRHRSLPTDQDLGRRELPFPFDLAAELAFAQAESCMPTITAIVVATLGD